MIRPSSIITALLALVLVTSIGLSCRLAEKLSGDPKAGTVSSLWSDVPPLPGATKADLEIPLGARLMIRAMMQGKVNFIAFTTDQTAADVRAFYSNDRMKAAGWMPSEKGCIGDTESDKENHGIFCAYKRKDAKPEEGLIIMVAQDEKTKQTELFYVRIELPEPSPSPK
ncbi:MAG TPA: hypothetical protein VLL54_01125 [Pyrinomonadaceae bacterium]|nr:hypothetical protein [Pyrinomonadaceae bacterium]